MRGREEREREDLDFENVFLKVHRIIFLHSRERLHCIMAKATRVGREYLELAMICSLAYNLCNIRYVSAHNHIIQS